VTLLCDGGERYARTYHDPSWLDGHGLCCTQERDAIHTWMDTGVAPPPHFFERAGLLG